jgi:hypothetical protein
MSTTASITILRLRCSDELPTEYHIAGMGAVVATRFCSTPPVASVAIMAPTIRSGEDDYASATRPPVSAQECCNYLAPCSLLRLLASLAALQARAQTAI